MIRTILPPLLTMAWLLAGCGGASAAPGSSDGAVTAAQADDGYGAGSSDERPLPELVPLPESASFDERLGYARQIADRLRLRSDRVHRWLRDARRAGYGNQTACLDDLLSQLHAAERDGTAANRAATAAAGREDRRGIDRELSRLTVLEERSRMLVQMARACGRPKAARMPHDAGSPGSVP